MDREKRTLLVVDGSATHLFSMGMLLRRLEYAVRTAMGAEAALQTMTDALPSLVITDTALPGMNGIDLLKRMKQDARLKAVPVIVHTSESDPVVQETCMAAGCAAYFKKPADLDALYRAVETATASAPRRTIRIDTHLKVVVGDGTAFGGAVRTEFVTALSDGGLYIQSLAPEPVNTVIPLTLFIRDREVKATAAVLYSSPTAGGQHKVPGMGMKFVSISPEDKRFVQAFIQEQVTKDLPGEAAAP